ncbi:hypothetical protein F2Q68_00038682 [Brassica cretica]|uniref:Uncharacterized protein n=2 Tax=Brassica cretica TaxID=69181 RepID=A0A8S9MFR9_BRACR|nr:hypothetical protein F2Q68_00038682 [Brassica cretica]
MTGLDRLIWTELPCHNRRESRLDGTGLLDGGGLGIYRKQLPISFRLVAARVSVCMAPVTCGAAPCAPYGLLHDLVACVATPRASLDDSMSGCMTGVHASRHTAPYMSARMRQLQSACYTVDNTP